MARGGSGIAPSLRLGKDVGVTYAAAHMSLCMADAVELPPPAMPPSAPAAAPRRGQGVVEGARISPALLSAFSSWSTDSKSVVSADAFEQASTSSPRALVGVSLLLVPELPQPRLGWIRSSFHALRLESGRQWVCNDCYCLGHAFPGDLLPLGSHLLRAPQAERGVISDGDTSVSGALNFAA